MEAEDDDSRYRFTPEMARLSDIDGDDPQLLRYEEALREALREALLWADRTPGEKAVFNTVALKMGIVSPTKRLMKAMWAADAAVVAKHGAKAHLSQSMWSTVASAVDFVQREGWDAYVALMIKKRES